MKQINFYFLLVCLLLLSDISQGQRLHLSMFTFSFTSPPIYFFKDNYVFSKTTYDVFYTKNKTEIASGGAAGGTVVLGIHADYDKWRIYTGINTVYHFSNLGGVFGGNRIPGIEYNSLEGIIPVHIKYRIFSKYKRFHTPYFITGAAFNFYYFNNFFEAAPHFYNILYNDKNHYWTVDFGLGYSIAHFDFELTASRRVNLEPYKIDADMVRISFSVSFIFSPTQRSIQKDDNYFY